MIDYKSFNNIKDTIIKPWGGEEILESNNDYTFKKLYLKEGESCSLQYHEKKHETIYVLSGKLKFEYSNFKESTLHSVTLNPGNFVVIEPTTIHRMTGMVDCTYLEASSSELNDVVRLEDNYGRVNNG